MGLNRVNPKLLLLLALAINLVAATVPFTLDPPVLTQNRLEIGRDGALVLHDHSMARTMSPPAWLENAIRTDSLTIDLQVRPASSRQDGPARILTISQDYTSQNLMIGQEQSDLVIRLRRPGTDDDGEPAFVVPDVFESENLRDILLDVRPGSLQVQIDRKPMIARRLSKNALDSWDQHFNLALGNEVIGGRAWNGVIYRAVISTPEHREDLLAVGYLQAPREWWEVPYRLSALFAVDLPTDAYIAILHVIAFMPIGYAVVLSISRGKAYPLLLVLILALAIGIEAAKIIIEDRHPTLLNVMANASGALVGAWFGLRLERTRRNEQ